MSFEASRLSYELLELIDACLLNSTQIEARPETVLDSVVDRYLQRLRKGGYIIGSRANEQLQEDLEEEMREHILDVIRKRTYGSMTIKDFQIRRLGQTK